MQWRRTMPLGQLAMAVVLGAGPVWLLGCGEPAQERQAPGQAAAGIPMGASAMAQQHLAAARRLAEQRQYEQAIKEFTAALDAMRTTTEAVLQSAPDADVLLERGIAYLKLGFPDTAAADFTEVLRVRPRHAVAYGMRGECHLLLGDLYNAVRDCTEAIRWQPDNAAAYRFRGQAYLNRGQYTRAVADLEQALALAPALRGDAAPLLAKAYARWSEQLESSGERAEADANLAKARQFDPQVAAAESEIADADASAGPVERTVAKPVVDDEAQELYEAGEALRQEGRDDEALTKFTLAIELQPDFADAYLRRGETLLANNFPDTAVKDFEQAIFFSGGSAEAYRLQAWAFIALDDDHRAELAATKALHADPSDALSYAVRGEAYVAQGNWRRGIVDLDEAVRRDPMLVDDVAPALERAYRLRDNVQALTQTRPDDVEE
jgi:tetratricopeptide (TPR) repeat protein